MLGITNRTAAGTAAANGFTIRKRAIFDFICTINRTAESGGAITEFAIENFSIAIGISINRAALIGRHAFVENTIINLERRGGGGKNRSATFGAALVERRSTDFFWVIHRSAHIGTRAIVEIAISDFIHR